MRKQFLITNSQTTTQMKKKQPSIGRLAIDKRKIAELNTTMSARINGGEQSLRCISDNDATCTQFNTCPLGCIVGATTTVISG